MTPKSFLFIILLPSILFSQELLFKNTSQEISVLDPAQEVLYQFSGDSLLTIDLNKLSVVNKKIISKPYDRPFMGYKPIWFQEKLILSQKNGGTLLHFLNDSLNRIDQSDIHNWQASNSLFVKNDTLYKYGGYGYWTATNVLSYYDQTSKGWEVVPFKSKEIPPGTHSQKHHLSGDYLYIIGGYEIKGENRLKTQASQAVWRLNFNTKEWRYLGEAALPDLNRYRKIQSSNKNDFELFNSQNGLVKVNLQENKLSVYNKNPLYFSVDHQGNKHVYKHKDFYYFYDINRLDIRLKKVSEKDFVLQQHKSVPFFVNKTSIALRIFLLASILGSLLLLVWGFKKRKLRKKTLYVSPDSLSFNKKTSPIDKVEYELLSLLCRNKYLESSVVLSLVSKELLTKSHNEKLKTQTIEALNLKLSYLLEAQGAYIFSEKSKEDKRIRVYSLSLEKILIKIVA